MRKYILFAVSVLLLLLSCNKDGEISLEEGIAPIIELDSETGIYITKVGREFTISPSYSNVESAIYSWTCDCNVLSQQPSLTYIFNESGSYYITVRVETSEGSDKEEIRVNVSDLAPPVISLAVPTGGVNVLAGKAYKFSPDVQNARDATFVWTLDGEEDGFDIDYTFMQEELGAYRLSLFVENEDGNTSKDITINVVDNLPMEAVIVAPSFYTENLVKNVTLGRTLYLRPYVSVAQESEIYYQWDLDGRAIESADSQMYAFKPEAEGDYTLTFTLSYANLAKERVSRNISAVGTGEISLDIPVTCYSPDKLVERPYTGDCSPAQNKVYEFVPAPGQFVNDTKTGGYNGESTHKEAIAYAQKRLAATNYVSLGGWGGYIVVGFDHSIANKGGYDFSITGNQFDGSSEPGIVYVMQDTNGNGLPDDEWYELKGSEYGKPETIQYYAVTYYRPGAKMATQWTDNCGNTGSIDYLGSFHPQDYYYPAWIDEDYYTLYGTSLQHKTTQNPSTGLWHNGSFGWGYADNAGDDMVSKDNQNADPVKNYFSISDAVNLDGSPADLGHIDFIKVQTGVNMKAGWLGEISTEVFGFTDENNNK